MTIPEIKEDLYRSNKSHILTLTTKPILVSNVNYMFDNTGRELDLDEIQKNFNYCLTTIKDKIYIKQGTQCLLVNERLFDKDEIECTFCGCSTLVTSEEDIFEEI